MPPDLAVPAAVRANADQPEFFLGGWGGGAWNGTLPTMLVVEKVGRDGSATVVYAWGTSASGLIAPGWERCPARISGGRLRFTSASAELEYRADASGGLMGTYVRAMSPPSYVELTRTGRDVREVAKEPIRAIWEEVRIPLPLSPEKPGPAPTLQATWYPSRLGGRAPCVILNHGSTGSGRINPKTVWRAWGEALVFRELGYAVLVPMRRGRGTSEGEFREETLFVSQKNQLELALADLETAMTYLRAKPEIDPGRIIVAGQSRGGFLAVVYAGRYPDKVVGVVNFSGGWWGEHTARAGFNLSEFRQAGRNSRVPMLWLYADNDSLYSMPWVEKAYGEFTAAGGHGTLFKGQGVPRDGHFLSMWTGQWREAAEAYLASLQRE